MFINPITAAMGAIELFTSMTSHHKKEEKTENTALTNAYNVNNMSFNELKDMALGLMQQGKLSQNDTNNFLSQISSLQQVTGTSKEAKVDMIDVYQQQIQNLNAQTKNNDVASLQHSLDILNGIKARSNATIPKSV
jgi:hypothetical protein